MYHLIRTSDLHAAALPHEVLQERTHTAHGNLTELPHCCDISIVQLIGNRLYNSHDKKYACMHPYIHTTNYTLLLS